MFSNSSLETIESIWAWGSLLAVRFKVDEITVNHLAKIAWKMMKWLKEQGNKTCVRSDHIFSSLAECFVFYNPNSEELNQWLRPKIVRVETISATVKWE